eukprot:TRINITY_DN2290_c0_g1_i6.p1 TRINITY_DN2290_c0_g1~~TRINITY_DN2290_c0_g1_i6.p1  ORF type:complete len:321 (+),score=25.32 TRINITY_DN2290_c0_g1_i6:44-1006(+)
MVILFKVDSCEFILILFNFKNCQNKTSVCRYMRSSSTLKKRFLFLLTKCYYPSMAYCSLVPPQPFLSNTKRSTLAFSTTNTFYMLGLVGPPSHHSFGRRWKSRASISEGSGGGDKGGSGANYKVKEEEGPNGFFGLAALWAAYLKLLEQQPLITKIWTCALLNGLGDYICQQLVEVNTGLDIRRLLTFTLLGAIYVAPLLHLWYGALNRLISAQGLVPGIQRMAMDQFFWAPLFVGVFMGILTVVQALPQLVQMSDVSAKLKQDWFGTVKLNWTLWVPAQTLNFWLVPPNLQVLMANITAIIWNVILSYTAHKKVENKQG